MADDDAPVKPKEEPPSRGNGWPWLGAFALAIVGVVVGLPALGQLIGVGFGFDTLVMSELNACPLATEALGSPIVHSTFGLSCGNAEGGCGSGDASWSEPVAGPKGRGSFSFDVHGAGGTWVMQRGTLSAGGRDIDIGACALAGRGEGVLELTRFTGKISSVTGPSPSPPGTACDVSIGPGAGPFGCRVVIACGGPPLYGATEHSGYTRCQVRPGPDGRPAVTALDSSDRPDGDPSLDLHTATGEILLSDRHSVVPWGVTIRMGAAP